MKCIIPCAGYATRLGEAGKNTPKTLIKIKRRSLIEYIIDSVLEIKDMNEIFVISNAKFYDQFEMWLKEFSCPVKITLINDGTTSNENRLGTLKDIQLALNTFDDDFLVVFGDSYFNFDLKKAYDFFRAKKAPIMVLLDIGLETAKTSGIVALDTNKKILSIVEKPQNPTFSVCSAGTFFLVKENKEDIKQYLRENKNPEGITYFLEDLRHKKEMFGYQYDNKRYFYIDIGRPEALEAANKR